VYRVCIIRRCRSRNEPGWTAGTWIRALRRDGWYEVNRAGSHKQFGHPAKKGRVTVPHPRRDIPIGTLKSIEKQAGIRLR
jgi:predicted RNA binding protein YcfA (HicA-like mRNA interferase family)